MDKIIVQGNISVFDGGEESNGLYVGGELLTRELEDLTHQQVSVRYFITDEPKDESEILQESILSLSGSLYALHESAYSEYTGYLWTDDELNIGGHDLISELTAHEHKYLFMEITVH